MSYYRLYSISMSGGHIVNVEQFSAIGDGAAILRVSAGEAGVARELWNYGRKVLDFAPFVLADDDIAKRAAERQGKGRCTG